jgi:cyclic beta-1,2-glucan synthetase
MAAAELATHDDTSATASDDVYRYFTYLSPAHRAVHPTWGPQYGIEPYVMAGDVYTQPPYAGRGGWSWYTGAAAWMHRAAVESLFGLQINAQTLVFHPCLPAHWQHAEITLRRETKTMRFILLSAKPAAAMGAIAQETNYADAVLLLPGQVLPWPTLRDNTTFVIPILHD